MAVRPEKIKYRDLSAPIKWTPTIDTNGRLVSVSIPWKQDSYYVSRSELESGAPKMLHFFEFHRTFDINEYGDLSRCELCENVTFPEFGEQSDATDDPVYYELERILSGDYHIFQVTYKDAVVNADNFANRAMFTPAVIQMLAVYKESIEERAEVINDADQWVEEDSSNADQGAPYITCKVCQKVIKMDTSDENIVEFCQCASKLKINNADDDFDDDSSDDDSDDDDEADTAPPAKKMKVDQSGQVDTTSSV